MARNNEQRTGAAVPPADAPATEPVQPAAGTSPAATLSYVVPTEFVELPSRGRHYDENHPLHRQEVVEIRHMTAKDEDILTSASLLKKGIAIDRLIKSIMVDKTIDPDSLLVGDRNAIIIAARSSAYGHLYETKVECPSCGNKQKHEFDLSEAHIHEPVLSDSVEVLDNGNYLVETPHSKIKVELRLLTGHDENVIFKLMNKNKEGEAILSTQMKLYIASVNEHSHDKVIEHFINNVPAAEARFVRNIYKDLAPTIEIKGDFECDSCNHEQELEVPFNTDFFWPDR